MRGPGVTVAWLASSARDKIPVSVGTMVTGPARYVGQTRARASVRVTEASSPTRVTLGRIHPRRMAGAPLAGLIDGRSKVTWFAELAVGPLRVVQTLQALPRQPAAGLRVRHVGVVVAGTWLARCSQNSGISVETCRALSTLLTCITLKTIADHI